MTNLIDLDKKRRERNGEPPKLYVNHTTGKISGSPGPSEPEFGDRLARIRASLDKINKLMRELKELERNGPNLR